MISIASTTAPRRSLFQPIPTYATGFLKVDDIHDIYWEQSGNPLGAPVVFLHGGPGGGTTPKHRQFFDPVNYRIILFDQRGSGLSTPKGELRNNTTELLVEDMERLRKHLGIEKWHIFGGSWGSTLGLCYAIAHPERCLSMALRGIFMMQKNELEWFLEQPRYMYPELWESFTGFLKPEERSDIIGSYYKYLTHEDRNIQLAAAKHWSSFESKLCTLLPLPPQTEPEDPEFSRAISRIEAHYFINNRFNPDDYILKNTPKIAHIPTIIIHGRYDMVCPLSSAYDLHKSLPKSKLIIVPDAGHSASEPGMTSALIDATENFKTLPPR